MRNIACRIDWRIALVSTVVLLAAVVGAPQADAAATFACEECYADQPSQSWWHNFPSNSGETDCTTGDGCHGIDFLEGACDVHSRGACETDPDSLDAMFAAAENGGDPWSARGTIEEHQLQIDAESKLLLVYSCNNQIAASVPLSAEQIATLNN